MAILPSDAANYDINTVYNLANSLITFITLVAGSAAVIAFIYGSIMYFTGSMSGEKEGKGAAGKKIVIAAVTGIIIIILARVIVSQVLNVLAPAQPVNVDNLAPTTTTTTTTGSNNNQTPTNTTPVH